MVTAAESAVTPPPAPRGSPVALEPAVNEAASTLAGTGKHVAPNA